MAAPSDVTFSFYNRGNQPSNSKPPAISKTPELFVPRRSSRLKSPISEQENVDVSAQATPGVTSRLAAGNRNRSPLATPKEQLSRRLERAALADCTNNGGQPTPKRSTGRLCTTDSSSIELQKPWVHYQTVNWEALVQAVAPARLRPKKPADKEAWRQIVDKFEVEDLYNLCRKACIWQLVPVQEVKSVCCIDVEDAKHGAFASVCPVKVDGQTYVAKVCNLDLANNPALDVIEEFRTMAHIPAHSNIVRASFLAFDYNPASTRTGQRCRALMLLERCNASLQDIMQPGFKDVLKAKGLYNDFVVCIAYGSATGLAYLHTKCGLLHCDVKEANILLKWPRIFTMQQFMTKLTEEHVLLQLMGVKIADFGLSLHVEDDGTFPYFADRGTHGYIAPECVDDEQVLLLLDKRLRQQVKALTAKETLTSKADVFSWGVTMWHVTDFRIPEEVTVVNNMVQQHRQAGGRQGGATDIAILSLKAKAQAHVLQASQNCRMDLELHAEVAALFQKCMSLDPEKRPTWQQIQLVLERHISQ